MSYIWQPHPGPQTIALEVNDVFETMYGGARGGGKTDAGMVWLLKDTENPLYRGLVIRRNAEDLYDWIDRARIMYPHATISGKPATIKFPSGAIIRSGHLKDDQAYTKYQGHEYHRVLIEELTQIPSEESYLKLISSCRSTVEGLDPKIFLTCNPGGKGHQWVKSRFIQGHTPKKAFKDSVSGRLRMFIPATVEDNPALLERDPDYVAFLDSLPEPLRSAWRKGDWDVFAGQYFTEWCPEVHVISEEEAKTRGYGDSLNKHFMGIDWGFSAPFCALWCQVTRHNRVFIYRELYGTDKHPKEWAEMIWSINKKTNTDISMTLADPSMWAKNPLSWNSPDRPMYTDKSIADAMTSYMDTLVPANNNRINGWRNMAQLMHWSPTQNPNFYIIKGTCKNLIRTLPNMVRDEKNIEDIDTDLEDHAVDSCRYMLSHIQAPIKKTPKVPILQKKIEDLLIMPDETPEGWVYNFEK
tara:strand:+ start:1759 stop:3165 length:1407 start_codon:yes stop_codon:yes gene_type:complete